MPTIHQTISALDRLRSDAGELHEALKKHELMLAPGHQNEPGRSELYGMIHRFKNVLRELSTTLAEPAPIAVR